MPSYITETALRLEIEAEIESVLPDELEAGATFTPWDLVAVEAEIIASE